MKIFKIIFFLFSLTTWNSYSQFDKVNEYEFLNINLDKNITDFGLSKWNLDKDINPIDLKDLSTSPHFLSKFNFDSEIVLFDKMGYIKSFLLKKVFEDTEDPINEYNEILNKIQLKYGMFNSQEKRVLKWNSDNYEINLSLGLDNKIYLIYNISTPIREKKLKKVEVVDFTRSNSDELKDYRKDILEKLNNMLFDSNDPKNKTFVRIKDNNLIFYIEVMMTSEYELEQYVKFSNFVSYKLFSTLLGNLESKKILEKGKFNNFIINTQFLGNKFSGVNYEKILTDYNFGKLRVPFTENEFEGIIIQNVK
tara:strand:+ start:1629 stop:2552 length:924 start_codon:yes stop_codon:yes gene_type:complete